MKRITDPGFRYTPSHSTDIKKTFERLKRERRQEQEKPSNVKPLREVNVGRK